MRSIDDIYTSIAAERHVWTFATRGINRRHGVELSRRDDGMNNDPLGKCENHTSCNPLAFFSKARLLHQTLRQPHEGGFEVHGFFGDFRDAEAAIDEQVWNVRDVEACGALIFVRQADEF